MVRTRTAHWRVALVVILMAAFALRLFRLGAQSLWYDETVSVFLAGEPFADLIAHTAGDIHPPAYYLLLKGWLLLSGYRTGHAAAVGHGLEFAASSFSLFFGLLLVALIYALGRRLLGAPVALIAAALTAISPFNVWYSQEARMYTLAATLGLVCLLGVVRFVQASSGARLQVSGASLSVGRRGSAFRQARWAAHRALVLYVIGAAAGLYVLYYFAFLLVALNLWVLGYAALECWESARAARAGRPGPARRLPLRRVGAWFVAQAAVLIIYAPWLPTAWRQATDPPVPPWRSFTPLWRMITETWNALSFGQSVDPGRVWPMLVLTAVLFVLGMLWPRWRPGGAADSQPSASRFSLACLPAAHALLPMALVMLISLVTPLYHVRYAFTYSPPFALVLAAGGVALFRTGRWGRLLASVAMAAIVVASGLAVQQMWTDAAYASDDHRWAVRFLSEQWRPGDAILVNAGYSYTAVLTYLQLPIAWRGRLSDYDGRAGSEQGAVILQTGHIDGDLNLGWDSARSDFYALSGDLAEEKMAQVFANHPRVWHYRIYDTVNDPQGQIRELLASKGQLFEERLFGGEANMRVEGYITRNRTAVPPEASAVAIFGDTLSLRMSPCCGTGVAGSFLDITAYWEVDRQPAADYATSLRLVDSTGRLWSQPPDEHPTGSLYGTSRWPAGSLQRQPLRLPLPEDTPPGGYHVELLVYDPTSGIPLEVKPGSAMDGPEVIDGARLRLGSVEVLLGAGLAEAECGRALARFDYMDLQGASSPATLLARGDRIPVDLRWCPRETDQVEDFITVLELRAADGHVVASERARPVEGTYPTSAWPTGRVVRDQRQITVPLDAAAGRYRLVVALERASDGRRVIARQAPLGLKRGDWVEVKTVEVQP